MQASVAGARNGDEPGVGRVAPGPLHEPRVGERAGAPGRCSDRSGSMAARSRGDAHPAQQLTGPSIGPARNVRSLTSQIRRPRATNRRHCRAGAGRELVEAQPSRRVVGHDERAPSGQR